MVYGGVSESNALIAAGCFETFPIPRLIIKARENGKRGKVYFQGDFSQREIRWNRLKVP